MAVIALPQTKFCSKCGTTKCVDEFYSRSRSKDGLQTWCKPCWKAHRDDYRRGTNRAAVLERERSQSAKYRIENPEAVRARTKRWIEKNKDYYHAFMRAWSKDRRAAVAAGKAPRYRRDPGHLKNRHDKRFWALKNATPPWADKKAIKAIYRAARERTQETGVLHVVDHIVPLISDLVCGLHYHLNLQVVTAAENARKGNSLPDE